MSLRATLHNKWFPLPLPPKDTFKGQRVLVTGANTGLGLATAKHLLNLSAAEVIITCRNATGGNSTKERLEKSIPGSKGRIRVMELDMDRYATCVEFVNTIKKDYSDNGGLDYIVLNAGTHEATYKKSPEGWEQDIQVNALSTTLIALLLLPYLKAMRPHRTSPAHLGIISSGTHLNIKIDEWKKYHLQGGILNHFIPAENFPGAISMYAISKLMVIYAVREIAKLALGSDGQPDFILNHICPGIVATELSRSMRALTIIYDIGAPIFTGLLGQSPENGSKIVLKAGLTTKEEHGKFIVRYMTDEEYKKKSEPFVGSSQGQEVQALVWKEIRDELVAKVPSVQESLL